MVQIAFLLKTTSIECQGGKLCIIIKERAREEIIETQCSLFVEDWNCKSSKPNLMSLTARKDMRLINLWDKIRFEQRRLQQIVAGRSAQSLSCTIDDVANEYMSSYNESTLFGFTLGVISRMKEAGNISNANNYYAMLLSFMTFRQGYNLDLEAIDHDVIEAYQAFFKSKKKGSSLNTISFYMRTLRAVINRAAEKGLISKKLLFKRTYIKTERTAKRAIPSAAITKLKQVDLADFPKLQFARDLFLFSYYTRGMSFIDIAYLKKEDLKNGEFMYRRGKTGQTLCVAWEQCMEDIAKRYANPLTDYMLPIIVDPLLDYRQQYLRMRDKVNRCLKKVAQIAELPYNISMYVARHSWATAAKKMNFPIAVISEALGHENESTTRIYLASLSADIINDANRLIINAL